VSGTVTSQAIGLPLNHGISLGVSHFAESNSPVSMLPESAPVSQFSTEYHSWSCVVAASASFYGRRDRAVPRCRCVVRMPYSQVFEPLLSGQPHLIVWDRSRLMEVHAGCSQSPEWLDDAAKSLALSMSHWALDWSKDACFVAINLSQAFGCVVCCWLALVSLTVLPTQFLLKPQTGLKQTWCC